MNTKHKLPILCLSTAFLSITLSFSALSLDGLTCSMDVKNYCSNKTDPNDMKNCFTVQRMLETGVDHVGSCYLLRGLVRPSGGHYSLKESAAAACDLLAHGRKYTFLSDFDPIPPHNNILRSNEHAYVRCFITDPDQPQAAHSTFHCVVKSNGGKAC